MNRLYAPVRTGRYINTYGKLTPGTEYYAIAYGNYNGNITTELFLKSFTTNEAQVGALEFSLEYGPWYDLMQLAEADPNTGWDYSAMYYDCLLPVDVPEELAGKEYYYALSDSRLMTTVTGVPSGRASRSPCLWKERLIPMTM